MKTFIKKLEGFNIYFEAIEEHIPLSELLPEDTLEQLKETEKNNVIFCAKVSAEKENIEIAANYLGGCIYESEEDFYTKYKDDYFNEMVTNVVVEAKEVLPKLIEKLQEL